MSLDADALQRRASDPTASVWVSASAGAGKTKVLSDRVLRVMLAGAPPTRLLCLTFTKAAAAEMEIRVSDRLAKWATIDDKKLRDELYALTGEEPTLEIRARARRLFAETLDAPGGLKIQTIHGFCQSLLKRFPLEAGLAPHFEVMEERTARELLAAAQEEMVIAAQENRDSPLAVALSVVTSRVHETKFQDVLQRVIGDRRRLRRFLGPDGGTEAAARKIAQGLNVPPGATEDSILIDAVASPWFDLKRIRTAIEALMEGGKNDQKAAAILARVAEAPELAAQNWPLYRSAFLTQKGEGKSRKTFPTKAVKTSFPAVEDWIGEQIRFVLDTEAKRKSVVVAEATTALVTVAATVLRNYQRRKEARAVLDYDDLVLRAAELLNGADQSAAWVLFKLDGGIDHILIDEAQDTNPEQWDVVAALAGEFQSGQGREEDTPRTLFAVGDVKQSIYSFQRADPERFGLMRDRFETGFTAAERDWRTVPITISFRSTPTILAAVDAVFAHDPARTGVVIEGEELRHIPFRAGQPGRVELWPPVPVEQPVEEAPWTPPVAEIDVVPAPRRLATAIAGTIAYWLTHQEPLASKGRPLRAGDIMILVRRRSAFVDTLVSELKQKQVPVAGVDRMVLTDQIAVMDLIAAGRFVLLPQDDLNLAALLKSPLIGLEEDDLFRIAHDRKGRLWDGLVKAANTEPESVFAAAADRLTGWMRRGDYQRPFEFYSEILSAEGGRKALVARLGLEANDPIDEFLTLAMGYERDHVPSLQGFLYALERGEAEIKRDLENTGADQVRIMTVHGAKGLQAPVVFLADTLSMPRPDTPIVLWDQDEAVYWLPKSDFETETTSQLREARKLAQLEEYNRLLYVALTRAEDRLVMCGWSGRGEPAPECWHSVCETGLAAIGAQEEMDFGGDWVGPGWVFERAEDTVVDDRGAALLADPLNEPLWDLPGTAPDEPSPPRPLAPSQPDEEETPEPAAQSPLAPTDTGLGFARGLHVHKLLQFLPDMDPSAWEAAIDRYLSRPVHGLDEAEQAGVAEDVLSVLQAPDLAPLFGQGSRAEVPIVGLFGDRALSGRMDRLVVTETEVIVADYKTNRPPPRRLEKVPAVYIKQMAVYRKALRALYPDKPIRCVLVWTHGARAMTLPDHMFDTDV